MVPLKKMKVIEKYLLFLSVMWIPIYINLHVFFKLGLFYYHAGISAQNKAFKMTAVSAACCCECYEIVD